MHHLPSTFRVRPAVFKLASMATWQADYPPPGVVLDDHDTDYVTPFESQLLGLDTTIDQNRARFASNLALIDRYCDPESWDNHGLLLALTHLRAKAEELGGLGDGPRGALSLEHRHMLTAAWVYFLRFGGPPRPEPGSPPGWDDDPFSL